MYSGGVAREWRGGGAEKDSSVSTDAPTNQVMLNVLPPPLSRAHRDSQEERARAVKAGIEELLADVDEVLRNPSTP